MKTVPLRIWIIAGLLPIVLSCDPKESQHTGEGSLTKPIKTLVESVHEPMDDSDGLEYYPEMAPQSNIVKTFFDKRGNILFREKYNSKGALLAKETNRYEQNGSLLEQVVYHYKSIASRKVYVYDAAQRLIESQEFNGDGKYIGRELVKYDVQGNWTIARYRSSNGVFVKVAESYFTESGTNPENIQYTNNRISSRELNRFDSIGQRIESIVTSPLKENDQIIYYQYDSLGNNTERVELNSSAIVEAKIRTTYDQQRNIRDVFTYGIKGSLKERIKHVYEYDEFGNWTKDVVFLNRKPTTVHIRKIEYY